MSIFYLLAFSNYRFDKIPDVTTDIVINPENI